MTILIVVHKKINFATRPLDLHYTMFILLTIGVVLSCLVNFTNGGLFYDFKFVLILYVAFVLSLSMSFYDFASLTKQIVALICIVSLIGMTLERIAPQIIASLPVVRNARESGYYSGIIFCAGEWWRALPRNYGLFWEPGILATIIILTTLICVLANVDIKPFEMVLFAVTIFTTYSTAGFFLFIVLLIGCVVSRINKSSTVIMSIILVFVIVIVVFEYNSIVSALAYKMPYVFGKLVSASSSSMNVTTRLVNPLIDLRIFSKGGIFGVGSKMYGDMFSSLSISYSSLSDGAQTSTFTSLLAKYGLFMLVYPIFMMIGFLRIQSVSVSGRIIFLTILMLIFFKEPHTYILFTHTLVFMILHNSGKESVSSSQRSLLKI